MDINKASFYPRLIEILTTIAESEFVAFDLELSGVPSKPINQESGKASLQRRYAETKEAAERYSILQIGLTCVVRDADKAAYALHPYNFDLNPLIVERGLDIERIISFQSGAAEFLLKSDFDLGRPFRSGVPYLSRTESKSAREIHAKRHDRAAIADIAIKATEIESLAFMARVRKEIDTWVSKRYGSDLMIGPVGVDLRGNQGTLPELSRFEKRLVHQLVRAEYPDLVTIPRKGLICVAHYDQEWEARLQAKRKRELEDRIRRQKGFRWVIDALLGGDVSDIDLFECNKDAEPATSSQSIRDCRSLLARAQSRIRHNPRAMVGHNCFLDLVYIYRTFIGALPATVEEFQQKLHERWPVIVDTKYMCTESRSEIDPGSSLEQVAAQLSREQHQPEMYVPPAYERYTTQSLLHEAGYDSYLTAKVALLLASKLQQEQSQKVNSDQPRSDQPELLQRFSAMMTVSPPASPAKSRAPTEGFTPSTCGDEWQGQGDPTIATTYGADDPFVYAPHDLQHRYVPAVDETQFFEGAMPAFDTSFWITYGNKLRVYGTEEGICALSGGSKVDLLPVDDSGDGGVPLL